MHPKVHSALVAYILVAPLCFLRNINSLSKVSLFGLTCMLFVVGVLLGDLIQHSGDLPTVDPWGSPSLVSGAKAVATIVFAFVSQATALNVFGELHSPTRSRASAVVGVSTLLAFVGYTISGVCGFLVFGSGVNANVLLMRTTTPFLVAKLSVALSMALSIPLLFFPLRDCFQRILDPVIGSSSDANRFNISTWTLVALMVPVSFLFENLDQLLSLFGSICASFIAFIFPSACILKQTSKLRASRVEQGAAIVLFVVGLGVFVVGTASSVYDLVKG
jgi:amino acid permease